MSRNNDWLSFNLKDASEIKVNDGCIKSIYLQNSKETEFDKDGSVNLSTGDNALIEFVNGKRLMINQSEWASLHWMQKEFTKEELNIKLSDIQDNVIKLIKNEGYELGVSGIIASSFKLQKGGIGKGGKVFIIRKPTFDFLIKNKLIEKVEYGFPVIKYRLTELGKAIKLK